MNYLFECECGFRQSFKFNNKIFECKNCNEQFVIGNYFRPYKLVETKAALFEDVSQGKLKGSLVPSEVRNKINLILGRKCNYTDKRKNCYSMKWWNITVKGEQKDQILNLEGVIGISEKTPEMYNKNTPSYYRKPYVRVYVEKLKGEINEI